MDNRWGQKNSLASTLAPSQIYFSQEKLDRGEKILQNPTYPAQEKGFLDYVFCFHDLGRVGLNKPPAACGTDRTLSVCRLALQTQLLTVCLTPPIPMLPAISNVSSSPVCENREITGNSKALHNSDSAQFQKKRFGSRSDWSYCPGCRQAGPAAQSQKSDRWKKHVGQTGWQEAHPVSSFWKGTGFSREAIFFLPRPAVSRVMKPAIKGELSFLTVRNPATTVSIHSTGVRDLSFAAGESGV